MNFAFGPSKVFLPPESGDMIEGLGKWKPIRESVLKGNLDLVAEKLSEVVEKEKVDNILGLDTSKYQVAAFLPFGYRVNEQSEQIRLSFDEVVEFIS